MPHFKLPVDVDLILISGIPGTGKSTYVEWLGDQHGFRYFHLDTDDPARGVLFNLGPPTFIQRVIGPAPGLALDWGFPPNDLCLAMVRRLHRAGVIGWWFDGDWRAAFDSFCNRPDHSVEAWDIQLPKIEAAWPQIKEIFGDRRIDVVTSGPTHMEPDEIHKRMFG
jgi:hypothetical protein